MALDRLAIVRSRLSATRAHPEHHDRIQAAAKSAEAFSVGISSDIDVEILIYVTDIADAALEALNMAKEVGPEALAAAQRVADASQRVLLRTITDHPHIGQLREFVDNLNGRINHLQLQRTR
jgi:hypothetical protein